VKSNLIRYIIFASLVALSRGQAEEIQENREARRAGAPTISAGGVVAFKLHAPNAAVVSVGGDWGGDRVPMTKDDKGYLP
jgi:hypothetical protein